MANKGFFSKFKLDSKQTSKRGVLVISLIWFLLVLSTYLFHHPYYTKAIADFDYWGLLIPLVCFLSVLFWWRFKKSNRSFFRGWELYLLILFVQGLVLSYYGVYNDIFEAQLLNRITYFIGFSIFLHFALLFIIGFCFALGEMFAKPLRDYLSALSFKLIAIALGFAFNGILMLLLGLGGILNTTVLWILLGAIVLLRYKAFIQFFKDLFIRKYAYKTVGNSALFALGILVIFISVSIIGGIKAFPIGFDGASLYMNKANLVSQYTGLPKGGQAFNWSLIMSMGILLFKSEAISILLSHLPSLLCLVIVYSIARLYLSFSASLWSALLFYSIPAVRFHGIFDEKVDLGYLFITLSTLLLILEYYKSQSTKAEPLTSLTFGRFKLSSDHIFYLILGLLTGFAFGIKYTALFNGISILCILVYRKDGSGAAFAFFLLSLSALFLSGIYSFANIQLEGFSPLLAGGLFLFAGLSLLFWLYRKKISELYLVVSFSSIFVIAAAFPFIPWTMKNAMENKSLSVSSLTQGKLLDLNPRVPFKYRRPYKGGRKMNSELKKKTGLTKSQASQLKAKREEIQRYLGYEKGLPLYLSIPFDATTNVNIPGKIYVDMGFVWLLLLPLLFLSSTSRIKGKNVLISILLFSFYLVFVWSAYPNKGALIPLLGSHPEWFQDSLGAMYSSLALMFISVAKALSGFFEWSSGLNLFSNLHYSIV